MAWHISLSTGFYDSPISSCQRASRVVWHFDTQLMMGTHLLWERVAHPNSVTSSRPSLCLHTEFTSLLTGASSPCRLLFCSSKQRKLQVVRQFDTTFNTLMIGTHLWYVHIAGCQCRVLFPWPLLAAHCVYVRNTWASCQSISMALSGHHKW